MTKPPTLDESILEPLVGGQALYQVSTGGSRYDLLGTSMKQDTGFLSPFQQKHALDTEVLLRFQG